MIHNTGSYVYRLNSVYYATKYAHSSVKNVPVIIGSVIAYDQNC